MLAGAPRPAGNEPQFGAVLAMAKDDTGPQQKRRGRKPPAGSAKGKAAFDLWLDRGLHTLFDDIASEPVPEDLLRLIEKDKAK